MGIIIFTQSDYLKFSMEDPSNSGVACFIVAIIEAVILILLVLVENRNKEGNVSRENYVPFESERDRPRESTFKGIAMVNLPSMREPKQQEELL